MEIRIAIAHQNKLDAITARMRLHGHDLPVSRIVGRYILRRQILVRQDSPIGVFRHVSIDQRFGNINDQVSAPVKLFARNLRHCGEGQMQRLQRLTVGESSRADIAELTAGTESQGLE